MTRKPAHKYKTGEAMQAAIIETGLELWKSSGIRGVTANAIGEKLNKTPPSILYHFGYRVGQLRDAIAEAAVSQRCVPVILQLISADHPAIKMLSKDEQKAFQQMM